MNPMSYYYIVLNFPVFLDFFFVYLKKVNRQKQSEHLMVLFVMENKLS